MTTIKPHFKSTAYFKADQLRASLEDFPIQTVLNCTFAAGCLENANTEDIKRATEALAEWVSLRAQWEIVKKVYGVSEETP